MRKTKKRSKKQLKKRKIARKKKFVKKKKTGKFARKKVVKKEKKAVRKKKRVLRKKKMVRRKIRKPLKKPRKRVVKKRKMARKTRKPAIKKMRISGSSLDQLFESPVKVQTMKVFFRNPETNFSLKEAARAMKINSAMVRKQMKKLEKIGFLKSRQISPRKQLFSINPNFDFFNELKSLILRSCPVSKDRLLRSAKGLGKIRLVLLSGLFVNNNTARADLLIVGDNINSRKLNTFIKNLEAEAGAAVNCVVMTTEEFKYRYDMYDRFVRDLLNEKNELLMNRLGV